MKERLKKLLTPLLALSLFLNVSLLASGPNASQPMAPPPTSAVSEQQLEELRDRMADQDETIASLQIQLEASDHTVTLLRQQAEDLSNQLDEAGVALTSAQSELASVQAELASAQTVSAAPAAPAAPAAASSSHTAPVQTPEVTQYVWITATGSKYHSKSNCGNTKTAWQVSIDDAKARGYGACKNCW